MMEGIYNRVRYLERKGKPGKYKGGSRGV